MAKSSQRSLGFDELKKEPVPRKAAKKGTAKKEPVPGKKAEKKEPVPPELSIIAPFYNEGPGVELFFKELTQVLITEKLDYEIICVNDGSTDLTLAALLKARESNKRIKVINLSRNFGKEIALTAGLD